MNKVLYGAGYDLPRLAGISHEMFVKHYGRQQQNGEVATYLTGYITTNTITDETGYIIDTESEYFSYLHQIHQDRLVIITDGDGWIESEV